MRNYFFSHWFIIFGLQLFLKEYFVDCQCLLSSLTNPQLCYSCFYTYNLNFTDEWPGPDANLNFNVSSCKYMINRPKLEVFVSPNICKADSPCNGSLLSPFDNLVKAFKFGWRSNSTELKYYLLSDGALIEGSNHFINKADYISDHQYLFRRFHADISIQPLYCSLRNVSGCLRNEALKPKIYVRCQSFYIFVAKSFLIRDVIFDGSEIVLEHLNKLNSTNFRESVCSQKNSSEASWCSIKEEQLSPFNSTSYGLFNFEIPIECAVCSVATNEKLLLERVEVRNFYSFGKGWSLGSFITVQTLRFYVHIKDSLVERSFFPNGFANSLAMPDIYTGYEDKYITAKERSKEKNFIFENSSFSDFNYYQVQVDPDVTSVFMFIRFEQIPFDLYCNFSFFARNKFTGRTDVSSYFIYGSNPEIDGKLNHSLLVKFNNFKEIEVDFIIFFYKVFLKDLKKISFSMDSNYFSETQNCCLQTILCDPQIVNNSFNKIKIEKCPLLNIEIGILKFISNEFNTVDSSQSSLINFHSENSVGDKEVFDKTISTNISFYEGALIEDNTFRNMNTGIVKSESILNFIIFNRNKIVNLKNDLINITRAKVERELFITNNIFLNTNTLILFNHEIFKNLSFFNNTLANINTGTIMAGTLYSPEEPFSSINITNNIMDSLTFSDVGFEFSAFYEKSGINYILRNNSFININGQKDSSLFSFTYSALEFINNIVKKLSESNLLKIFSFFSGNMQVNIDRCFFEGSSDSSVGYVFYINEFLKLTITDSYFLDGGLVNVQMTFGYLLSTAGKLLINNCTFANISSISSGVFFIKLKSLKYLLINESTFMFNQGLELGGDLTVEFIEQTEDPVQFDISLAPNYGVLNNIFIHSKGIEGGSIKIMENAQILLKNNTFIGGSAYKGGAIFLSQRSQMISRGDVFMSISTESGGAVEAVYSSLLISNGMFKNCKGRFGGCFYAELSKIIFKYSRIFNTSSEYGGSIYLQGCEADLLFLKINDSRAVYYGGAFYSESGELTIRNLMIKYSRAIFEGNCLYINRANILDIQNLEMSYTDENSDGMLVINGKPETTYLLKKVSCKNMNLIRNKGCFIFKDSQYYVSDILITETKSAKCTICLIGSKTISTLQLRNITIEKSYFSKEALIVSGYTLHLENMYVSESKSEPNFIFLSAQNSMLYIRNMVLQAESSGLRVFSVESTYFEATLVILNMNYCLGGLMASKASVIDFRNIYFNKADSKLEGGFGGTFKIEESEFTLKESKIVFARGSYGSFVYSEDSNLNLESNIFIGKDFEENLLSISVIGAGTYGSGSLKSKLTMSKCGFINLAGLNMKNMNITNITDSFFERTIALSRKSANLHLEECAFINVQFSDFLHLETGGDSPLFISSINTKSKITLEGLNFNSCYSTSSGGAILLEGYITGEISRSSFQNNTSEKNGGALFMNIKAESDEANLKIESCNFSSNKAFLYGDNAKINEMLPLIVPFPEGADKASIFSYPIKCLLLKGIGEEDKISEYFLKHGLDKFKEEAQLTISDVPSGQAILITILVLDHFGNLVYRDETGKISFSNPQADQSINFENDVVRVKKGVGVYNKLMITAPPNDTYVGIINYFDEVSRVEFSQNISIQLRPCVKGEILNSKKCEICPKNYYSLDPNPMNKHLNCQPCPSNALCPGGSLIIPEVGFWRKDENQSSVIKCSLKAACPPYSLIDVGADFKQICQTNYKGNLCYKCTKMYAKIDTKECILCTESLSYICKYTFLVLFSLSLSAYQIHTAFSVGLNESKRRSLLKLLFDHFTFIGLLSRFNIDWEAMIQTLISLNDNFLSVIPSEMFNFDCLSTRFVHEDEKFKVNSILVSFSPFFYGTLNILIFYTGKNFIFIVKKFIKKAKKQTKNSKIEQPENKPILTQNLFATALIIFYNFYPRLLNNGIAWLKCLRVDDSNDKFLESDPDLKCWTPEHNFYIISIAAPSIFVWSIGAPIILFIITLKLRKRKSSPWQQLINYISIDYKEEFFFWDLFIYTSKFVLVFSAMICNNLEPKSQGAVLIVIILFVFLIVENYRPYKYPFINNMYSASYIVSICTASLAIMGSTKGVSENQKFIFILLLVALNLLFYIYWAYYFLREGAGLEGKAQKFRSYFSTLGSNVNKIFRDRSRSRKNK